MSTLPKVLMSVGLAAAGLTAFASTATAANVECTGTFTGVRYDNVTVPDGAACTLIDSTVRGTVRAGQGAYFQATGTVVRGSVSAQGAQTIFIDTGSRVSGNIRSENTAQVFVFGSMVAGNLNAHGTTDAVQICTSTIRGNLKVQESGRDILVGDPLTIDCAGNDVRGNVAIEDNVTDIELVVRGNTVGGNMRVSDNSGPSAKAVQDNNGRGQLECTGNAAPFIGTPNQGLASQRGQCA